MTETTKSEVQINEVEEYKAPNDNIQRTIAFFEKPTPLLTREYKSSYNFKLCGTSIETTRESVSGNDKKRGLCGSVSITFQLRRKNVTEYHHIPRTKLLTNLIRFVA